MYWASGKTHAFMECMYEGEEEKYYFDKAQKQISKIRLNVCNEM